MWGGGGELLSGAALKGNQLRLIKGGGRPQFEPASPKGLGPQGILLAQSVPVKKDPDNSPSLTSIRLVPIFALFMSSEHSEAPKERGRREPGSTR